MRRARAALAGRHAPRERARRRSSPGMFALTLLVALPLAFALRGMIATHLGGASRPTPPRAGTNYDWWQEFSARHRPRHHVRAVDHRLRRGARQPERPPRQPARWPRRSPARPRLAGPLVVPVRRHHRSLRARPADARTGFFAACGLHFWRLLRLGMSAAWSSTPCCSGGCTAGSSNASIPADRRTSPSNATAFVCRLGCLRRVRAAAAVVNLIFDYARIRIVVEDRRSALGALDRRRAVRAAPSRRGLGCISLNGAAFLCLVLVYAVLAPGVPRSGVPMWLRCWLGELYILVRHYLKLLFYASETASSRARSRTPRTRPRRVVWPESPAAEAILNADSIAS